MKSRGEKIWRIVKDIIDIQYSVLVHGHTISKEKRMGKKLDKLAELCGISHEEINNFYWL